MLPTLPADKSESSLQARHAEIERLVEENAMDRCTKRLLDLARDFGNQEDITEALIRRREYNALEVEVRRTGHSHESVAYNQLAGRVVKHANAIRDGALRQLPVAMAPQPAAPRPNISGPEAPQPQTALELAKKEFLAGQGAQRPKPPGSAVVHAVNMCKMFRRSATMFELSDVSLSLVSSQLTGVVGTNGSGKTTLLRLLAGELRPDDGTLSHPALEGECRGRAAIRDQISYVSQQPRPWFGTVEKNLLLRCSLRGLTPQQSQGEADFYLHRLGLEEYRDASRGQLPGGFLMRFELALALVRPPRLLILDEPLAPLDILAQRQFLEDLRDMADSVRSPLAIIVSSQHIEEIEAFADQLLVLDKGRMRFQGPVQKLGVDRRENSFEIACARPPEVIREALSRLPGLSVEQSGQHLLIRASRVVTGEALLGALLQVPGLGIKLFRDTSLSSRRMLEAERPT